MTKKQILIILLTITLESSIILGYRIGENHIIQEPVQEIQESETTTPEVEVQEPVQEVYKIAKITAYTCDPTMTPEQKALNCPNGITAIGTKPRHKKTVACPRKYLGKQFDIEGVGVVTCEDVGGAIKGEARFDLFLDTYSEAIQWGTKYKVFKELQS